MRKKSILKGGRLLALGVFASILRAAVPGLAEVGPQWWADRGVLAAGPANDFAALNTGQLKHLAYLAWMELETLPGGAGFLPAFTNAANDYSSVTVGQLKEVARPFYDRLGLSENCSWVESCAGDYAVANIGQAKNLFCFAPSAVDGGNRYLVIDLSGGPEATRYPVRYLQDVPSGGWTDEYKTTKLVLRRIPAGTFLMGSMPSEVGHGATGMDESRHTVALSNDFYIGVFEVTQRQWELTMGTRPSFFLPDLCYATRPVESVSYYDVREQSGGTDDTLVEWPQNNYVNVSSFIGRLRAKTGHFGLDIPTEAQWEYACRAGTVTALNSGNNVTNIGYDAKMNEVGRYWYNGGSNATAYSDSSAGTAPVGLYLSNAWGLYDMHGNVSEWCLDWYEAYEGDAVDPTGAESGAVRVTRGGGWQDDSGSCRSASRNWWLDWWGRGDIGFRVAETLLPVGTCHVSFDFMGGKAEQLMKNAVYGVPYGPMPTPGREGYAFDGWWLTPDGGGARITEETKMTQAADHTLYAKWAANTYVVAFVSDGDEVTPASKTVAFGSAYGVMPVPTRKGYVFCGWWTWTDEDGWGVEVNAGAQVALAADHTLFARWAVPEIICISEKQEHWEDKDGYVTYEYLYTPNAYPSAYYLKQVYEWTDLQGGNPESGPLDVGPGMVIREYDPRTHAETISVSGRGTVRGSSNYTLLTPTAWTKTCDVPEYDDPPGMVSDEPGTQVVSSTLWDEYTDELLLQIANESVPAFAGDFRSHGNDALAAYHLYKGEDLGLGWPSADASAEILKAQYRMLISPAAGSSTLMWYEEFVPDDDPATPEDESDAVEYAEKTWVGCGPDTSVFMIDPYARGQGKFGVYSILTPRVDLNAAGCDDSLKATIGAYLPLNQGGDDNFKEITLRLQPRDHFASGTLSLSLVSGGDRVRIWKWNEDHTAKVQCPRPATWPIGPEPFPESVSLLVEGVQASAGVNDVELRASCSMCGTTFSDSIKMTVVDVDLDIDSDSDGGIEDADDLTEESVGGLAAVGGADLTPVNLRLVPGNSNLGRLTLSAVSGGEKIAVWMENNTNGIPAVLPKTWIVGVDPIPPTVYVQGVGPSGSARDVELTATYSVQGAVCEDTVSLTVVEIALHAVALDANGRPLAVGGHAVPGERIPQGDSLSTYVPYGGGGAPAMASTSARWVTFTVFTNSVTNCATLSMTQEYAEGFKVWDMAFEGVTTNGTFAYLWQGESNAFLLAECPTNAAGAMMPLTLTYLDAEFEGLTNAVTESYSLYRHDETNGYWGSTYSITGPRAEVGMPAFSERSAFVVRLPAVFAGIGLQGAPVCEISVEDGDPVTVPFTQDQDGNYVSCLVVPVSELDADADLGLEGSCDAVKINIKNNPLGVGWIWAKIDIKGLFNGNTKEIATLPTQIYLCALFSALVSAEESADARVAHGVTEAGEIARTKLEYAVTALLSPTAVMINDMLPRHSVWVHSGHGSYKEGITIIKELGGNRYVATEFMASGISRDDLAYNLVFMNTCESTDQAYEPDMMGNKIMGFKEGPPTSVNPHAVLDIGMKLNAVSYVGWDCKVERNESAFVPSLLMEALDTKDVNGEYKLLSPSEAVVAVRQEMDRKGGMYKVFSRMLRCIPKKGACERVIDLNKKPN